MDTVLAGQCRTCHRNAVQVIEEGEAKRTYHPWKALPEAEVSCAALLPILGMIDYFSLNIPHDQFIPDVTQP